MEALRTLVRQHRLWAFTLVAVALCARLLVPSGFMPVVGGQGFTVQICTGAGPMMAVPSINLPQGEHQSDHKGDRAESPCAFAGLAMPSLGGADPVLLALAILFVMGTGLLTVQPLALPYRQTLRPPLRGPPLPR